MGAKHDFRLHGCVPGIEYMEGAALTTQGKTVAIGVIPRFVTHLKSKLLDFLSRSMFLTNQVWVPHWYSILQIWTDKSNTKRHFSVSVQQYTHRNIDRASLFFDLPSYSFLQFVQSTSNPKSKVYVGIYKFQSFSINQYVYTGNRTFLVMVISLNFYTLRVRKFFLSS